MKAFPHSVRSARGFTLVEALVSLLVLSIGLLGVAALQLSSLRANNSASYRSQATFLAYDIADRMRANRAAALANAYNIGFGEATASSPATVAERDLKDWLDRVSASLPGSPTAQVQSLGNAMFAIRIRWNDTHGDSLNTSSGAMSAVTGDVTFEMRTRI